jgi:hypothetical protein
MYTTFTFSHAVALLCLWSAAMSLKVTHTHENVGDALTARLCARQEALHLDPEHAVVQGRLSQHVSPADAKPFLMIRRAGISRDGHGHTVTVTDNKLCYGDQTFAAGEHLAPGFSQWRLALAA